MRQETRAIKISGEDVLFTLSEIDYLLISLRNIARYYYHTDHYVSGSARQQEAYCTETTEFIDRHAIAHRLAHLRKMLSEKMNLEVGADGMDDVERYTEKVSYWEKPGD